METSLTSLQTMNMKLTEELTRIQDSLDVDREELRELERNAILWHKRKVLCQHVITQHVNKSGQQDFVRLRDTADQQYNDLVGRSSTKVNSVDEQEKQKNKLVSLQNEFNYLLERNSLESIFDKISVNQNQGSTDDGVANEKSRTLQKLMFEAEALLSLQNTESK